MRVNLAILFVDKQKKSDELVKWVVEQNLTAYWVPAPLVLLEKLLSPGFMLFGELHGNRQQRLQGPDWQNGMNTDMALAQVHWASYRMDSVDSPFGRCYILSADFCPVPKANKALYEELCEKLRNNQDKRYFDIACTVKVELGFIHQLVDLIGIDVSTKHIVTTWEHEYREKQQPKFRLDTGWYDEEGRAVGKPELLPLDQPVEPATPAAKWRENGEPDPFGIQYDKERAKLPKGDLTDDELANAVFCCDHRTDLESIVWLTAAKERIRWLSRALVKAQERVAELESNKE